MCSPTHMNGGDADGDMGVMTQYSVSCDLEPKFDVRLYAPSDRVVIVWACGELDSPGGAVLARQVGRQLTRAQDVVVDLCNVTAVGAAGVDALRRVRKEAAEVGVQVHLAAEREPVRQSLVEAALDEGGIHLSAGAAIATLPS